MKVSAYTSGNFKISDVQVIMKTDWWWGRVISHYLNKIIDPGMSNMTSATEQVAIINFSTVSAKVFDKPLNFSD